MQSTRVLVRAQPVLHPSIAARNLARRYATNGSSAAKPAASGALTGGLVGGASAFALAYGYYHFSGAKTAVQTATQTKAYVDKTFESLKAQLPGNGDLNASDALKSLRDTAGRYAVFIPGGKKYVDAAFSEVDSVREKHGEEVDKIVREAIGEMRDVSKKGLSLDTAGEMVSVLVKHLERLSELAKDAAGDFLEKHPELKEKVGGSVDQLKQLGDKYGPEAKKQVDDVRSQISDLTKNGLQKDTLQKVQKLIQEKTEQIQKMGQQAYDKGMEEVKPLLEKNSNVKKLVQDNMDKLKGGNVSQLVSKVKDAISSGDTGDLEKYINQATQKGSGQLSSWLGSLPAGGAVLSQFSSLQELAQSKGKEAEALLKETIDEIKQLLENKLEKAKKIKDSAKEQK